MKFEIVSKNGCYPCKTAIKHYSGIAERKGIELIITKEHAEFWPYFYVHENGNRRHVTRKEFSDLIER